MKSTISNGYYYQGIAVAAAVAAVDTIDIAAALMTTGSVVVAVVATAFVGVIMHAVVV